MATKVGSLIIQLALESGAFSSGLSQSERELKASTKRMVAMGKSMQELGKTLSLAVTLPLAAFAGKAMKTASDAAELESAFRQTFGGMSGAMRDWAVATGDAMGRSTQEMEQGANTFGLFFNQAAKTREEAAEMSKTFTVLAQDLSSFFNVDPDVALQKLRSGLSGESEPLRDFGVFLTEATVKAQAMKMGLVDASGAVSEQAKVMARAALIMEATKNAQGDVARTAGGTANQVRAAKAAWEELQVTIGAKLLPAITPLITKLTELLNQFNALPQGTQTTIMALAGIAAAAGPVTYVFGSLAKLTAPFTAALGLIAGQGGLLLAAQAGFAGLSAVLVPFLPLIGAVAAVGAVLYATWDQVGPALAEVGAAIGDAFGPAVTDIVNTARQAFSDLMGSEFMAESKQFVAALGDIAAWLIKALGPTVVGVVKAAVALIAGAFHVIVDAIKIVGAVLTGDWAGAWQAAKDLVRHAVEGIGKAAEALLTGVLGTISRLVSGIKDWLVGRLNAVWDWVIGKLKLVGKAFYDLYDAVVGHSYIPDMVDGIADNMARLDAVMVEPAKSATERTRQAFEQLQQDVQALMADLFPDARDLADFEKQLATFDKAIKAGGAAGFSVDQLREGRTRLIAGTDPETRSRTALPLADQLALISEISTGPMARLQTMIDSLPQAMNDNAQDISVANVRIAKSFKDMAEESMRALRGLTDAIKRGDFFDILDALIGVGLQLGSIGVFGQGFQTKVNSIPKFATGTSFAPGGLSLVGERGPELVNLPRGAQVIPNSALKGAGTARVEIVDTTGLFRLKVNGQIMEAAPTIARAGADGAVRQMAMRQSRRVA